MTHFKPQVENNLVLLNAGGLQIAVSRCEMVYPLLSIAAGYETEEMGFSNLRDERLCGDPVETIRAFSYKEPACLQIYRFVDTDAIVGVYGTDMERIVDLMQNLLSRSEAVVQKPSDVFVSGILALDFAKEAIRLYELAARRHGTYTQKESFMRTAYEYFLRKQWKRNKSDAKQLVDELFSHDDVIVM